MTDFKAPEPQVTELNTSLPAGQGQALFDADAIFRAAQDSAVHVNATNPTLERLHIATSGSGFIVDDGVPGSCLVALTNHELHLNGEKLPFEINGKPLVDFKTVLPDIEIQTRSGNTYQASVALLDPKHELALVRLNGVKDPKTECKPLQLDTTPIAMSDQLVGVGVDVANHTHPVAGTKFMQIKRGIGDIAELGTDPNQEVDGLRGTAVPGDSGTGMLRANGRVGAIVSGGGSIGFGVVRATEIQADIDLLNAAP